jgi:hypothetical protein
MTPIHDIFKQYIIDSGLVPDYKMQTFQWSDSGNAKDKFIVIAPDGGPPTLAGLGNEYGIMVTVVGDKNQTKTISDKVSQLLQYIIDNPQYPCIYHMYNLGGFPRPMFTIDNRIVLQIQINVISN